VYTTRRLFLQSTEVDKIISEIIPGYIIMEHHNRSSCSSVPRVEHDVANDRQQVPASHHSGGGDTHVHGSEANERESQAKHVIPSTTAASTSSTDHDSIRSTYSINAIE